MRFLRLGSSKAMSFQLDVAWAAVVVIDVGSGNTSLTEPLKGNKLLCFFYKKVNGFVTHIDQGVTATKQSDAEDIVLRVNLDDDILVRHNWGNRWIRWGFR